MSSPARYAYLLGGYRHVVAINHDHIGELADTGYTDSTRLTASIVPADTAPS